MRLKAGVNPVGIKPEINLAMMIADAVYKDFMYECVITSINDSTHSATSRHYQGMAFDLRTRHMPAKTAENVSKTIQTNLGNNYFVLLESNHIHVSYKPRKS